MHELSVTQNLLELALKHAAADQARRITDLYLVIGRWSSIVDDSVQFYWDIISRDTLAAGARLHFQRVPTELHCLECDRLYQPLEGQFACPDCGSLLMKIITGEEFYLEAIDVE